jgi:hypothetical protein
MKCPLYPNSRQLDEQRSAAPAQGALIFVIKPRVLPYSAIRGAHFIFMADTVRGGLGTCGKAAIMKRKVYANVA